MRGRIYFPGLHALRFFAACLVIFHHIHQYKFWIGLPNIWGNPVIDAMGHKAVSFFFVLSGFLITYLLLAEHQKTKKVNVPAFYLRRVLRIWPLYFLIVALALWVVPTFFSGALTQFTDQTYTTFTVIALLAFIPNVLRIVNPTVVGANQLWSVGIEEQFYLIWPLLVRGAINWMLPFLFGFTLLKFVGHAILAYWSASTDVLMIDQFLRLYALFPVEQMALGAIGATFMFQSKERVLRMARHNATFFITLGTILILALSGFHTIGSTYLEGLLFTIVILNVVHRPSIYQVLEHRIFHHLGNISYGIYMYHSLVIFAVLTALNHILPTYSLFYDVSLYILSVGLTLVVSHFSFQYFEKPFLKMKDWLAGGISTDKLSTSPKEA